MRASYLIGAIAVVVALVALWKCRGGDDTAAPNPPSSSRARDQAQQHLAPGSLAGRVSPVGANATVCARRGDAPPHCTLAADDSYAFADLAPGTYFVWAGDALGRASERARIDVAPSARATVDLALPDKTTGVRLTGHIRDVRGHAIAGATVHVNGGDDRDSIAHTDPDGAYVAFIAAGDTSITAVADGFVTASERGTAPGTIDLALVPESTLSGVVVYASTGEPVPHADVSAGGEHSITGADGRFRIAKLSPGRYKATASALGGYGEAAESVLVALGAAAPDITIKVFPVAVVVGKVTVEGGAGCPADTGEVQLSRYGSSAVYRTKTLDDGAIVLEGVVPGTYEVSVRCEGWVPRIPYADLVVADRDVEDLAWTVVGGARIAGRVVTAKGEPIPDVTVNYISGGGQVIGHVMSKADGTFEATGIAPGSVELVVRAGGYATPERTTIVAAMDKVSPVDIVLDRGGSITGDVVDETGAPVPGAKVWCSGPDSGGAHADADGAFSMDSLAPGHYDVMVDVLWDDKPAMVTAEVTTETAARVHLVARRRLGAITGTVRDPSGRPIADAYVEVSREHEDDDARRQRGLWSDRVLGGADGRFTVGSLPPGRYSVRAYETGGGQAIVDHVEVGASVDVVIAPTASIEGVIVSSSGTPVEDATISAQAREVEVSRDERMFHTGGAFALRDLPAGTYKLEVDGDQGSEIEVTLADGEHKTGLRLVKQTRYTIRGRLVDGAGASRVGWRVEAPHQDSIEHYGKGVVMTYSTDVSITGADGRFLFHNLPAGTVDLGAIAPGVEGDPTVLRKVELGEASGVDVDVGDLTTRSP